MKISRVDLRKIIEEVILKEYETLRVDAVTSALKQEVMQFQDVQTIREKEDEEDIIGEPPGMPEPTA